MYCRLSTAYIVLQPGQLAGLAVNSEPLEAAPLLYMSALGSASTRLIPFPSKPCIGRPSQPPLVAVSVSNASFAPQKGYCRVHTLQQCPLGYAGEARGGALSPGSRCWLTQATPVQLLPRTTSPAAHYIQQRCSLSSWPTACQTRPNDPGRPADWRVVYGKEDFQRGKELQGQQGRSQNATALAERQ